MMGGFNVGKSFAHIPNNLSRYWYYEKLSRFLLQQQRLMWYGVCFLKEKLPK